MPPTKSRKTYQGFEEKRFHLNYNDTEFDVLVWWYNLDSQYVIKSVVSCNLEDCKFDKFPFSKSAWVKRGITQAISRQKEEEKKNAYNQAYVQRSEEFPCHKCEYEDLFHREFPCRRCGKPDFAGFKPKVMEEES